MSRISLLIVLLIGPTLFSGLLGCEQCNPSPYKFRIQEYKLYTQEVKRPLSDRPLSDTLTVGDTINYQDLTLAIWGTLTQVARQQSSSGSVAWACDPAYLPLDKISRFFVISNQAFSNGFPAGANLLPVLTVAGGLTDFSSPAGEFLSGGALQANSYYRLQFTHPPALIAAHQFTVTIAMSDGRIFLFKTPSITILP